MCGSALLEQLVRLCVALLWIGSFGAGLLALYGCVVALQALLLVCGLFEVAKACRSAAELVGLCSMHALTIHGSVNVQSELLYGANWGGLFNGHVNSE